MDWRLRAILCVAALASLVGCAAPAATLDRPWRPGDYEACQRETIDLKASWEELAASMSSASDVGRRAEIADQYRAWLGQFDGHQFRFIDASSFPRSDAEALLEKMDRPLTQSGWAAVRKEWDGMYPPSEAMPGETLPWFQNWSLRQCIPIQVWLRQHVSR